MARSFGLDDNGLADNGLTIVLLVVTLALSVFDIWVGLGLKFHLSPIIVFLLTRFLYRRHFRSLLERNEAPIQTER